VFSERGRVCRMVFMDVDGFHDLGKQCISTGPLYLCGLF
jgi:hypothetical protein